MADLDKYKNILTPEVLSKCGPLAMDPVIRTLSNVVESAKETDVSKQTVEALEDLVSLSKRREMYVEKHCSTESDTLENIRTETKNVDWDKLYSDGELKDRKSWAMLTGKVQGEFLKFMVSMQQAKRVLDIGMFTGYSALAMAEAVPPDGVVVTCDIEPYLESFCRKRFDKSPHGKKINIRIGDSTKTLKKLAEENQKFDFVFVDADKTSYHNYYNMLLDLELLAKNGTIAFDNAFFLGLAFMEEGDLINEFNEMVERDARVRRVLLPIRDGVLLVRRAEDVTSVPLPNM